MAKLGVLTLLVLALGLSLPSSTTAQSTAFSFQGNLSDGPVPANGNYDFEFRLFDALAGGNQLGPSVARNGVVVTTGTFSVELDFGPQFPGAGRFLEIRVRPPGGGGYTLLVPRQVVQSTPYSVRALESSTAGNSHQLGGVDAAQYVLTTDPRMSNARDPLPGSVSYVHNGTAQQASASFNISGNGTAAGALTGDVVRANTHFLLGGLGGIGGQRVLSAAGSANLFVGVNSAAANPTGIQNAFFGFSAGNAATTGNNNSFFGAFAGDSNTDGDANSFFGSGAGDSNTTGNSNSAFGRGAGGAITTSSENSFFGRDAGAANTASGNSFFGAFAGDANSTGSSNSFFGRNAGGSNLTGFGNAFFGESAGAANNGTENAFFGRESGLANTSGDNNSFFGASAGRANSEGTGNSIFGHDAGDSNTSGSNNSFFGRLAGHANVTGGAHSVFGAFAGGSITGGFNNTLIGASADVASGDLAFATAIGSNAVVSSSNTIQLGRASGADTVIISGILRVFELGNAGSTSLCRNAANGIATCSSSIRYKSNVVGFRPGLEIVKRLVPVRFAWTSGGMNDLGLIAEEVARVEPLLTTRNGTGEVEGVKYDRLGVVLINAVNEQQLQIEAQARENAKLKEKLESQDREIRELRSIVCSISPASPPCRP